MAKLNFAFRQRIGPINWKIISGIDMNAVIKEVKIDDLQSILDIVTFSEFKDADVNKSTVQTTVKLVQLMVKRCFVL